MAEPIVGKTITQGLRQMQDLAEKAPNKEGPSKFDKVRTEAQNKQAVELPPPVQQVSPAQQRALEGDLRRRLESSRNQSPRDFFKVDMKKTQDGVGNLRTRVEKLPKTSAFEPLRDRLSFIEQRFQETGKLIDGAAQLSDPREMLKLQMQVHQLMQNVEITTKVVDSVTQGTKQILQTQV